MNVSTSSSSIRLFVSGRYHLDACAPITTSSTNAVRSTGSSLPESSGCRDGLTCPSASTGKSIRTTRSSCSWSKCFLPEELRCKTRDRYPLRFEVDVLEHSNSKTVRPAESILKLRTVAESSLETPDGRGDSDSRVCRSVLVPHSSRLVYWRVPATHRGPFTKDSPDIGEAGIKLNLGVGRR